MHVFLRSVFNCSSIYHIIVEYNKKVIVYRKDITYCNFLFPSSGDKAWQRPSVWYSSAGDKLLAELRASSYENTREEGQFGDSPHSRHTQTWQKIPCYAQLWYWHRLVWFGFRWGISGNIVKSRVLGRYQDQMSWYLVFNISLYFYLNETMTHLPKLAE